MMSFARRAGRAPLLFMLWVMVTAASACPAEPEPVTPADVGAETTADVITDAASDLDVGPDLQDAPSDIAADGDADGTDADAEGDADADAEVDAGPPPIVFETAPEWFYQQKIEGIVLDEQGESEQLKVTLPDGTSSVFVMLESPDDFHFLNLKTVVTPKPATESIIVGAGNGTCIPCKNRVSAGQKVGAFLIPNDPGIATVKGGEWRFTIRGTTIIKKPFETTYPVWPGIVDMTLLARTEPIPAEGRLVLHLHFTGADDLTAANAPTDPRLEEALINVQAILGAAGITVEVGGYHDVPGVAEDPTLLDLQSTLGAPNDLSKVLLTAQTDDPNALNVFFVNSIYRDDDFAGGGLVLGIAAGIPGPAFMGPNYRGGVVIASLDLMGETDYWGNVIAHEISHFLGLYHTTEKSGSVHDTLDDTAEGDSVNLMHWAYAPEKLEISEQQGTVLRSHPLVLPMTP